MAGYGTDSSQQGNGHLLITCFNDCNNNQTSDFSDIADGTSQDTDLDGIPDECQPVNRHCDQAVVLEENQSVTADNNLAGTGSGLVGCGSISNGLWFTYTARCDGKVFSIPVTPRAQPDRYHPCPV